MGSDNCYEVIENETKENIENLLRFYECDDSLIVDSIKCMAGSKSGDNYMSVVKRIIVKGRQNNNDTGVYMRHLIVKRQIANLERRQLFRCDQAFLNEIGAYCDVIPKLRQIASTVNKSLPIGNCLYAGCDNFGEIIVLDDLKSYGYRMADRLKGLDYRHCKIVLQALGELHGVSLAAKRLHTDDFQEIISHINESIYCSSAAKFFTHSLESSLNETLFSLRKSNLTDKNLSKPIECIEKLRGKLYDTMCRCVCETSDNWMVICHGDLWINNLMFCYDDSNQVCNVKFVDLQTLRYTSPVIDILHFLYTSTEYDVRHQHMDQLLNDYVESLHETLCHFAKSDTNVESIDVLKQTIQHEMRIRSMYGLGIGMWLMPAVTFDPNNIINLDEVTMDDFTSSNQEKNMTQMQTPAYHKRMKEIALEFYENGILK